jgi:hypothetical protein
MTFLCSSSSGHCPAEDVCERYTEPLHSLKKQDFVENWTTVPSRREQSDMKPLIRTICRSQWPRGLRPRAWSLGRCDPGFESSLRHGCLSSYFCVVCLYRHLRRADHSSKGVASNVWIRLNSINQLIFVMVKCGVLFEVRTGFLNII